MLLLVVMLIAVSLGPVNIPLRALLSHSLDEQQAAVLWSIRLPRVVLAVLVGAALAISGAALQGLFRNPLADPGLIGITSGAALFVSAAIVLFGGIFTGILGMYGLSLAAFMGGLLVSLLIFRLSKLTGTVSLTYMLLAGIALNALALSGINFMTFLSTDQQMRTINFWMMGSLGGADWQSVIACAVLITPCLLLMLSHAKALNILMLGEEEASYLGIHVERLKLIVIVTAALSVGAAVSVSGIIVFIGLIIPHLIRLTIGPDHRMLIPASAICGAILLVVADTIARTIVSPAEMPVGILTSLIGGPFFLWLLIKQYAERFA